MRRITDAVHARGGRIVLQIAHNGRNSHSSLMPDGELPVAPSPVTQSIPALTSAFAQAPPETPRALETSEIPAVVGDFRQAALHALAAGFDGVELQGANSHLIEQFLENGTNERTDAYGGPKENRARFLFEIVDAVSSAIGSDRLGVRLSPFGQYGGIYDSNPLALFTFVIREMNRRRIAYLHLIEARGSEMGLTDELHDGALNNAALFRPAFDGPLLSAAAYTPESMPTPWRSGECSSPTLIFRNASGPAPPSTRSTGRPPTAAAPAATPTIRRSSSWQGANMVIAEMGCARLARAIGPPGHPGGLP